MKFLKEFNKKIDKMETVTTNMSPPSVWYSTGNYALNRILSGSFTRGIPQGRLSVIAGNSGCLPSEEVVQVYEFKTCPYGEIKREKEEK
jgi:hypothetical protein